MSPRAIEQLMLNAQHKRKVEVELARIDKEIAQAYEDGYMPDVDLALDERWKWMQMRQALADGLIPNG